MATSRLVTSQSLRTVSLALVYWVGTSIDDDDQSNDTLQLLRGQKQHHQQQRHVLPMSGQIATTLCELPDRFAQQNLYTASVPLVPVVHRRSSTWEEGQPGCPEQPDSNSSSAVQRSDHDDDDFPNLSRHGSLSLLRKYLTQEIWKDLRDKRTSMGVTLEDIIRAGVTLPWGVRPKNRGLAGVYCGDAESYKVFEKLLNPLIEEHHLLRGHSRRLQRHQTSLNFKQLTTQRLDPNYILYTRMRLARSLSGFRFSPCIGRAERRQVERLIRDCTSTWETGEYLSVMDMSNEQHDDLLSRRILFPDPDEHALSAGLGRDWPDGRGLYCDTWNDDLPSIIIWCNMIDHLRIISISKGGNVQDVFTRLSKATTSLETSLKERGHEFVEDRRLGYLNSSPRDIGTAFRASVYVKLVRLGQQPGLDSLIQRLRLEARPFETYNQRYTGIFDIANAEMLGKTEVELINTMIRGVAILIDLEKELERGKQINLDEVEYT